MDQVGTGHPSFELLSAYHDAELTPAEHQAAAAHLDRCTACRKTLAGFDLLGMVLRTVPAATCADLGRLLSAELNGETSPAETAVVAGHLAACASCRAKRISWQFLHAAIAALPAGMPSAAADARIRGLAHRRRRRLLPTGPALGGGNVGRAAAALVAIALALVASLPRGAAIGPSFGAGPNVDQERPLVASMQQVLNPATNTLYVLRSLDGLVLAKNAATNAEVAQISVGGRPTALALNEGANLVYVLDPTAKTYTTISGATNTVTATASVPLTGTLTSIQVNQSTGQVLIGAIAIAATSAAPSGPLGQLAIIDPASQKIVTRSVDVAPTQVVLNSADNRMYLLGAKGTSVVDATTYSTIATLPVAIAIAPSATGGADAILSSDGGRAKLSFYGTPAGATFDGTPINVVGLPDGSFALLLDVSGRGRIQLVDHLGGSFGALDVAGAAKSVTFDPDGERFLGANGQVVATIKGTSIALVSPTPPPAPPSAVPTSSGVLESPSAQPAPVATAPSGKPAPSESTASPAPVAGATLAAIGLYRLDLGDQSIISATSSAGRLWFIDQRAQLTAVDMHSGVVTSFARTNVDPAQSVLAVGGNAAYIADRSTSQLTIVDLLSAHAMTVGIPFGGSVSSLTVALDGHVWLAAPAYAGLLDFDPRIRAFSLIALPSGGSPTAVAADRAGRIWFADAARNTAGSYEPTVRRIQEFTPPTRSTIVRIVVDGKGEAWFGAQSGEVFTASGSAFGRSSRANTGLLDIGAGGNEVWYLGAARPQVVGTVTGVTQLIGPTGARSLVVDDRGRAWLGGPGFTAVFIALRQ